jgi:hypothetical protein
MATAACPGHDDSFSCSICLEEFTKPKLLSCFHTFCCKCIQQHMYNHGSRGAFNCPICRAEIDIPTDGKADAFQTNFYLTGRHDLPCVVCEFCDNSATMRCLECEDKFCKNCIKQHAKSKATRDHHVVGIGDLERSTSKGDVEKTFGGVVQGHRINGHVELISSFTTGDTSEHVVSIVPCSGDI